jgi:hypothetical protein
MSNFAAMDSLTASLWRELQLQALPIRIVSAEEWVRAVARGFLRSSRAAYHESEYPD